jgi:hypothetical protein
MTLIVDAYLIRLITVHRNYSCMSTMDNKALVEEKPVAPVILCSSKKKIKHIEQVTQLH